MHISPRARTYSPAREMELRPSAIALWLRYPGPVEKGPFDNYHSWDFNCRVFGVVTMRRRINLADNFLRFGTPRTSS